MEIVIDSNVLFRILISQGNIIELMFNTGLKIYAPQRLWEESLNNEDEILAKSSFSKTDFQMLCSLLLEKITFVQLDEYKNLYQKQRNC